MSKDYKYIKIEGQANLYYGNFLIKVLEQSVTPVRVDALFIPVEDFLEFD